MKHVVYFLLALCVSATGATYAFAHGASFTHEESKDGYKAVVGYDEFIAADESVRFDFSAYPENGEAPEGDVFNDIWVTITKDKKIFFAGGVSKPVFGTTGFTFVFPEEGTYTLSARFQKEGEEVIKTEFPIDIIPPLQTEKTVSPVLLYALFALSGLVIGAAVMLFIPRKTKQTNV